MAGHVFGSKPWLYMSPVQYHQEKPQECLTDEAIDLLRNQVHLLYLCDFPIQIPHIYMSINN